MQASLKICFVLFVWHFAGPAAAQTGHASDKKIIDSNEINHWPGLGPERAISGDGRYFMYAVENQPFGSRTLVVLSLTSSWKMEIIGGSGGSFCDGDRGLSYSVGDSLYILNLQTGLPEAHGLATKPAENNSGPEDRPEAKTADPAGVRVDVWNWQDSVLQSFQLANPGSGNDSLLAVSPEWMVIRHNHHPGDRFWLDRPDSCWLVSLKEGTRFLLPVKSAAEFYFSPDGRWLVFYDPGRQGHFFSYDTRTRLTHRLSAGIPDHWLTWNNGFETPERTVKYPSVGIAGWGAGDTSLLVYDNYDIWKLRLDGRRKPVNITGGYGRRRYIKFRIADAAAGANYAYRPGDSLLLIAFNTRTKCNGFYRVGLSGDGPPRLLSMKPWTVWHQPIEINNNEFFAGMPPLKAANSKDWVVMAATATDAPNYFLTHDFVSWQALTHLAPQENYNWLTTELVSWRQPDGFLSQGVLYKPENFDPRKKYPLLIHYYEQYSQRLFEYPRPDYTNSGNINIPWFVSRGYLVFTPDIYYHRWALTQSACTTVESAARFLSKFPFIDKQRIGIAGHSWGGSETNYIVTHTHLFAAALSGSAGHSGVDLVSNALSLDRQGANHLSLYERDDIGATIWQRPDWWVKNSPIYQANRVSTPLLILHNKADDNWERAVEFFIALRRLGKRVWMLQYDHGGHAVYGEDAKDFTIRVTQFFDHWLKGERAPVWMERGIHARLKGISPD